VARLKQLSRTVQNAFEGSPELEAFHANEDTVRTTWGHIASRAIEQGLCQPTVEDTLRLFRITRDELSDPEQQEFSCDEYDFPGSQITHLVEREFMDNNADEFELWYMSFIRSFDEFKTDPKDARTIRVSLDHFTKAVFLANGGIENISPIMQKFVLNAFEKLLLAFDQSDVSSDVIVDGMGFKLFSRSLSYARDNYATKLGEQHWDRISHLFEVPRENAITSLLETIN
jgi:hypothetical protein